VHAWLEDLFIHRPGIQNGRMYWPISPAARLQEFTASGLPIGLPSDAAYLADALEGPLSHLLVTPSDVGRFTSVEHWRKATIDVLQQATI
jgi:hypothetical protein